MSVYVIRHSDKEKGDFYDGELRFNDQPISEAGVEKSLRLIPFFRDLEIEAVYISQYRRTEQTIKGVATEKKLTPMIDGRLNEIDVGVLEQMPDEQIQAEYPDFWQAYLDRDRDFRFPGGETGEEAGNRIFDMLNSLDRKKDFILVCHDGIIRTLICKVLSLPTWKRHLFKIDLCSITVFDYLEEFQCWSIPKINLIPAGNGEIG